MYIRRHGWWERTNDYTLRPRLNYFTYGQKSFSSSLLHFPSSMWDWFYSQVKIFLFRTFMEQPRPCFLCFHTNGGSFRSKVWVRTGIFSFGTWSYCLLVCYHPMFRNRSNSSLSMALSFMKLAFTLYEDLSSGYDWSLLKQKADICWLFRSCYLGGNFCSESL